MGTSCSTRNRVLPKKQLDLTKCANVVHVREKQPAGNPQKNVVNFSNSYRKYWNFTAVSVLLIGPELSGKTTLLYRLGRKYGGEEFRTTLTNYTYCRLLRSLLQVLRALCDMNRKRTVPAMELVRYKDCIEVYLERLEDSEDIIDLTGYPVLHRTVLNVLAHSRTRAFCRGQLLSPTWLKPGDVDFLQKFTTAPLGEHKTTCDDFIHMKSAESSRSDTTIFVDKHPVTLHEIRSETSLQEMCLHLHKSCNTVIFTLGMDTFCPCSADSEKDPLAKFEKILGEFRYLTGNITQTNAMIMLLFTKSDYVRSNGKLSAFLRANFPGYNGKTYDDAIKYVARKFREVSMSKSSISVQAASLLGGAEDEETLDNLMTSVMAHFNMWTVDSVLRTNGYQ